MITNWIKYPSFLFLLFISHSCKKVDSTETPVHQPGSAEFHYQQQALTKDRWEKLDHINRALEILQDQEDTLHLKLLRLKTVNHYYLDNLDSTIQAATGLINQAQIEENLKLQAQGHFFRGWALKNLDENTASFRDSFRAKELFIQLNDSAYAGRAWFNMAVVQQNAGDYAGAQKSATEILRLLNPEKDSSFIAAAHNEIGRSFSSQRLFEDAVEQYEMAVSFATSFSFKNINLENLSLNLAKIGEETRAIGILDSLLSDSTLNLDHRIQTEQYLAYLKWKQDPSLDISPELEKAYQYFKQEGKTRNLLLAIHDLAEYYQQNDPARALEYAREHLSTATRYGNPQMRLNALEHLVELSSPQESKEYALEFIKLSDSLSQARLQVRNLFAKIQYDEEQKELEILKLENRTAQQNAAMAIQRQGLIVAGSITILLLFGGGFAFYYTKLRHRKEKLQQVLSTEARIAKKVHDELANDIYVVMTQLENKAPSQSLDQLEDIYLRTRDISRENSSITTGAKFGSFLMGMLQNYIPDGGRFFAPGFDDVPWSSLSDEIQVAVFRSLQELMTNMKKHSKAKAVVIKFEYTDKELTIKYADRGVGMAKEKVKFKNGLENVENRISAVAGIFNFESSEGEGVKATIQIPI